MLNLDQATYNQEPNRRELLDDEGFLLDPTDWNRQFTQSRAQEKGIELTDLDWRLVELIRDKYLRLGSLPLMRHVCKQSGIDKLQVIQQFGSCLALWKMAGLPNPGEEAKAYMN